MKLLTYKKDGLNHLGMVHDKKVYNVHELDPSLPDSLKRLIEHGEEAMQRAKQLDAQIKSGKISAHAFDEAALAIQAPIPDPTSCRDGYAFRQHVAAARRNRGVALIPEFDQYPIFYFTNHNAIGGPGDIM